MENIEDFKELITRAREEGIFLKSFGSAGIILFVLENKLLPPEEIHYLYANRKIKDLDLVGYGKQRSKIQKYFENKIGFIGDFHVNRLHGRKRHIYYHPENKYQVDVFFDKLEFNQDIEVKGLLEKPGLSLELPYLLLTKLQIHQPTAGDLMDIAFLLSICDKNSGCMDDVKKALKDYLKDNWGFWYSSYLNIDRTIEGISSKKISLTEKLVEKALENLGYIKKYLDEMEKGKKWHKRAKIGTKKPWYREIEEPRL